MRTTSSRSAAIVVLGVSGLLVALTSCQTQAVTVSAPTPNPRSSAGCEQLVSALPDRLAGQQRRSVEPATALAAAWGDPPIVLRCGVARPVGLTRFSRCDSVNRVDWYTRRTSGGYRFTTIGRAAYVEVRVPEDYVPAGDALVDVAPAVKRAVPAVTPCV